MRRTSSFGRALGSTLVLVASGCAGPIRSAGPTIAAGPIHGAGGTGSMEGRHFLVYRGDGERADLGQVIEAFDEVDAVLVGEEHDDLFAHAIELELFSRAFERAQTAGRGVALSLEMFERDVQSVVDEYLDGLITEEHFLQAARPWDNYRTDYRPLVEFARLHGVPVWAANAPRRYVNRASRLGRASLEELPVDALRWLPPLPYPEPSAAHRAQWDALMGDQAGHVRGSPLDGQLLWDASMGETIARVLDEGGAGAGVGPLVFHLAGGFHVESGTGIPEMIERYRPGTRALVVALVPASDIRSFQPKEHAGRGDFVVLTEGR